MKNNNYKLELIDGLVAARIYTSEYKRTDAYTHTIPESLKEQAKRLQQLDDDKLF